MRLFGDFFALTVQAMNFGAAILGALLLARTLPRGVMREGTFSPFVFWVVAVSPPLVTLATSGMETALVFLALAALVYGLHGRNGPVLALASLLLPLLRVEAMIAPALVVVLATFRGDWRSVMWTVGGAVAGVLVFFGVNLSLTGEALPQTIKAKNAAYQPSRTLYAILDRIGTVFFEKSFFLGITTKLIPAPVYAVIGAAALACCAVLAARYGLALRGGRRDVLPARTTTSLVVGFVLVFPLGYIYGGVIFPWYLWPSSVFAYYLLARLAQTATAGRAALQIVTATVVTGLSLVNLLLLTNAGYQEAQYRAEIGRFIAAEAEEEHTLFLEPAGYIPFYAGLKTWGTVGLVSPDILTYRRLGNPDWWIEFVRDKRPTWIIERSPVHRAGTPYDTFEEGFTARDREEFALAYELERHFVYDSYLKANRSIMTPVYLLGGHSDYYVYRRK
jgi:hypothetical protein